MLPFSLPQWTGTVLVVLLLLRNTEPLYRFGELEKYVIWTPKLRNTEPLDPFGELEKYVFRTTPKLRNTEPLYRFGELENDVIWTTPKHVSNYKKYDLGANITGLLFAGRFEFNWIVDIRVVDRDQEEWSTGNLVSLRHVLTTCKAVDYMQLGAKVAVNSVRQLKTNWIVDNARVHYCKIYLWASNLPRRGYDGDSGTGGSRSVSNVIRHPECSKYTLAKDAAILVLKTPIPANEPLIGYMPAEYVYTTGEKNITIKLNPNDSFNYKPLFCYVASFGKNSVNHYETIVLDYKVKYRVYRTKWAECAMACAKCCNIWPILCSSDDDRCSDVTLIRRSNVFLRCMKTRAPVGSVCDHDRGSPVVCEGKVVVRGPKFQYCNNLYNIPFIAEMLNSVGEFVEDVVKYAVTPVPFKVTHAAQGGSQEEELAWLKLLSLSTIFYPNTVIIYVSHLTLLVTY